ncbi:branched-chain amino acid ABC transporter permease [Bradyrhizobium sp. SHOUNA76]|uniref:branched-chain amino acid ABC transporter permease n=1 Tax=Bradyrhizobium sp. SHOUNA76 TaxID=2908927 RepID=UPI001FF13ACF|nr:branched-chain amino acid ABC transporter permease [Bradyrhizobium sp. SHOUNA76]MCJ9699664.1 branched-chain amino acid ABC transporter permease [Bradyrhizobium sp. SHOUNA76]
MQLITVSLLNGVFYGLLLFMLASGLTLIFSMMGVLNFAHGAFYMLGAYFAFQAGRWIGFWPALMIVPLVVGTLGAAVEHWGLRRIHRYGHVPELLFTFGLAFVVHEVVQAVWGRLPVNYPVPPSLSFPAFSVFSAEFPAYRLFMMAVSLALFGALRLVLTRTRIGLLVQAALVQPDMLSALGHNVPRIFALVFGLGCGMAGLAGVIGGNAFVTEPAMAESIGTIAFVIVVIGGLGSLTGAFIASLLVGIVQTFCVASSLTIGGLLGYVGVIPRTVYGDLLRISLPNLAPLLPYALLVLTLAIRPRGLMGRRE